MAQSGAPVEVSIHAFRGEGDPALRKLAIHDERFNPRLPGGRRPGALAAGAMTHHPFQSTPSGGKATQSAAPAARDNRFNPRLPGGRRPYRVAMTYRISSRFNPRLPGGRRPPRARTIFHCWLGFNPRLPGGRRPLPRKRYRDSRSFNPRLPGGRRLAAGDGV